MARGSCAVLWPSLRATCTLMQSIQPLRGRWLVARARHCARVRGRRAACARAHSPACLSTHCVCALSSWLQEAKQGKFSQEPFWCAWSHAQSCPCVGRPALVVAVDNAGGGPRRPAAMSQNFPRTPGAQPGAAQAARSHAPPPSLPAPPPPPAASCRLRCTPGPPRLAERLPPPTHRPARAEAIYEDFEKRKAGLLRALTEGKALAAGSTARRDEAWRCPATLPPSPRLAHADVEDFYKACDPDKENLCLYGGLCCSSQQPGLPPCSSLQPARPPAMPRAPRRRCCCRDAGRDVACRPAC